MRKMPSSRLARCLYLLDRLRPQLGATTAQLARDLEVSQRTIFRDLRALEAAGLPVRYDRTLGRHMIGPEVGPCLSRLTEDELIVLLWAAGTSVPARTRRFGPLVRRAVSKLLGQLDPALQSEAIHLLKASAVKRPSKATDAFDRIDQTVWSEILQAIRERRCVRISYDDPRESGFFHRTKLSPYRLVRSSKGWSVLGRSSLHGSVRSFSLLSIYRAELTEDVYELPQERRRPSPVRALVEA